METRSLDGIKARLPEYLQSLGLEPKVRGENKLSCRCPLHADSKPSFTATCEGGVWVWFCFPCAKGGTVIDLHAAIRGSDAAEAIRELGERFDAPLLVPQAPRSEPRLAPKSEARLPMPWPVLNRGRECDLAELAELRGLPLEAVRHAQSLGYLRFADFKGMPCYAFTDGGQVFLQLRRTDGERFPFPKHNPIKAWNWKDCRQTPLGARHLGDCQPVLMAEGAISILELLSLLHLAAEVGLDPWSWACLAMTSGSASIPVDLLPRMEGRLVRILFDEDTAGEKARDRWTAQLRSVGCCVQHVNLATLPALAGTPHPDLGDFIRLPNSEAKQATLHTLLHL